jgi:hypothetical protein
MNMIFLFFFSIFLSLFLTLVELKFIGMTCILELLTQWVVMMTWQHALDIPVKHVSYLLNLFLFVSVIDFYFYCFSIVGIRMDTQGGIGLGI